MNRRIRHRNPSLPLLALLSVFLLGAAGSEPPPSTAISLGEFYLECARAFGIPTSERWTPSNSWLLLHGAGLELDWKVDFDQALRQKHVVHVASQIGIPLSSSAPEDLFGRAQVEVFLARYREYFRLPLKRPATPAPAGEKANPDRGPDSPGGSHD